jgi:guanylate kinase
MNKKGDHAGKLLVFSAPSGAGKTTIINAIRNHYPQIRYSVSATTRPRTAKEKDGVDYFFLSEDEFGRKIKNNEFIEWNEFYGHKYGSLKVQVQQALNRGEVLLFDVDVDGGLNIKNIFPEAVLIFIQPPSVEILKNRLVHRKRDSEEEIELRLQRVPLELQKGKQYDYTVVNDFLEKAIGEVVKIIRPILSN